MINIRKIVFVLLITPLLCNVVYAEDGDIFESIKSYANSSVNDNNLVGNIDIVYSGDNIDSIIDKKAIEKYKIAVKTKNKNNSKDNEYVGTTNPSKPSGNATNKPVVNPDKYPNQSSYFAGTTDFTSLLSSKKDTALNSWSAIRESYSKYDDGKEDNVTIIATAYTSAAEENGGWAGMNAIGGKLGPGCIAAPKDIPFQTKIRISGLGVFNVEDRGGAIVRVADDIIRIDVWMNSYREAMHFGKRVYKGRILA